MSGHLVVSIWSVLLNQKERKDLKENYLPSSAPWILHSIGKYDIAAKFL